MVFFCLGLAELTNAQNSQYAFSAETLTFNAWQDQVLGKTTWKIRQPRDKYLEEIQKNLQKAVNTHKLVGVGVITKDVVLDAIRNAYVAYLDPSDNPKIAGYKNGLVDYSDRPDFDETTAFAVVDIKDQTGKIVTVVLDKISCANHTDYSFLKEDRQLATIPPPSGDGEVEKTSTSGDAKATATATASATVTGFPQQVTNNYYGGYDGYGYPTTYGNGYFQAGYGLNYGCSSYFGSSFGWGYGWNGCGSSWGYGWNNCYPSGYGNYCSPYYSTPSYYGGNYTYNYTYNYSDDDYTYNGGDHWNWNWNWHNNGGGSGGGDTVVDVPDDPIVWNPDIPDDIGDAGDVSGGSGGDSGSTGDGNIPDDNGRFGQFADNLYGKVRNESANKESVAHPIQIVEQDNLAGKNQFESSSGLQFGNITPRGEVATVSPVIPIGDQGGRPGTNQTSYQVSTESVPTVVPPSQFIDRSGMGSINQTASISGVTIVSPEKYLGSGLASMGTSTPYQEAGVRTVDKSLAMNLENTENPTRDNYVPKYVPNTEYSTRDRQAYDPDPTMKETRERNNYSTSLPSARYQEQQKQVWATQPRNQNQQKQVWATQPRNQNQQKQVWATQPRNQSNRVIR